jgi:hypothetical protein
MLKQKVTLFLACMTLIAVLISGCAAAAPSSTRSNESAPSMPEEAPSAREDSYDGGARNGAPGRPQLSAAQRMVIRTATLKIVVDDPAVSMETISRMAEEMGGFVVSQNLYKTTSQNDIEYPQADITVRVPAENLTDALAQIRSQVKEPADLISENVSGQDVTNEYTDLRSRLKNLQQAEEQLREIMASAQKTEDVLAVHQQLTQIREQIEVLQGQIKYYEEAAALSSISVNIQAKAAIQPLEIGGWQPVGVARDAVQALIFTMQVCGSIAIWGMLYLLPVGLVIAIPILLVIWLIRRASKKGKVQAPPAASNPT